MYFFQLSVRYEISSKLEAAEEWNVFYLTHDISIKISKDIKFKCAKHKLVAVQLTKVYLTCRSNGCSFAEAKSRS